jgi:LPXTG-motif cell wall-anchored protein
LRIEALSMKKFVKGKRANWMMGWLLCVLFVLVGVAEADDKVQLTIRLRYSDGTAVVGETVILQRLPEEEAILPACVTDTLGECGWRVGRGLYQVLFARPLDSISALVVAEGGLRGFGLTVGDDPITYHFTFHSDGRVYFDAAPEAAVPSPIIPSEEALHDGVTPTPALLVFGTLPAEAPAPEATVVPETAVPASTGSGWRLFLFIGGGLVLGGGFHFLRRRQRQTPRLNDQETNHD